ncbi:MAG: RNA polymerase sigma factor [Planctomycetota bacterium]|jgi:RNA polymerase sigma-70 factor (ECF subfamily)
MLKDTILIWKFNRGSADALREIYEKYRGTMLTVATALCNDVHTAEDIVQDCFISFARTGRQLKVQGSLKAYLTTSVVNRARDRYRAGKRQPLQLDQADMSHSRDKSPETSAICNEQLRRLSNVLADITPEQREVVVLRTRGRMTYKEIANVQGVSIPTVRRRYHSGLDKLRILLNGEVEK